MQLAEPVAPQLRRQLNQTLGFFHTSAMNPALLLGKGETALKPVTILFLFLLGGWGVFASGALLHASRPWSRRTWLSLSSIVLLVSSAWGSGATLVTGHFTPWMLVPLGVSYVLMLPLPCYFPWITETRRRHFLRNVIFAILAAVCLAVGLKIIPLSAIGL